MSRLKSPEHPQNGLFLIEILSRAQYAHILTNYFCSTQRRENIKVQLESPYLDVTKSTVRKKFDHFFKKLLHTSGMERRVHDL